MTTANTRRGANPVDLHVGGRMRMRRMVLGMSQEKLGEALGLTFQQVQKYERCLNRISASRLFDVARVLDVPVAFFFDGMAAELMAAAPVPLVRSPLPPTAGTEADPVMGRETLDLVRAYYRIRDPRIRHRVYDLAKALSESQAGNLNES
ncbi:MAG: helix-turn-helix transcriptional regulator [Pseudomonadota bacterium]